MSGTIKLYTVGFLLLLLAGCAREEWSGEATPDRVPVQLSIVLSPRHIPVIPRSESSVSPGISLLYDTVPQKVTRSLAEDTDYIINDLLIIQFNAEGKIAYQVNFGAEDLTPKISGDKLIYIPELELEPLPECTIYAVANRGNTQPWPGSNTLELFEKASRSYAENLTTGMPMSGCYKGPVDGETGFTIPMERMLAKIDLTVNIGELSDNRTLDVKSAQLVAVATMGTFHNTNQGLTGDQVIEYPQASGTNFTNYSIKELLAGSALALYLPENIRGIGLNVTGDEKQKYALNDPTYSDDPLSSTGLVKEYEAGYSSRLLLRGTYSTQEKGERNIVISLYPGADVLNDYTIARNTLYRITANITDINPVQDGGDDYRIYLSEASSIQSYAHAPEIAPIYEGAFFLEGTGSYYQHPGETVERATVIIILPDGSRVEAVVMNLEEGADNTFTFSFAVFPIEIHLPGRSELYAFTRIVMSSGEIVESEMGMTRVRPAV